MWESDEGETTSYWQSSEDGPKAKELTGPTETEVCVIGGGIAGLTTAYLLSKAGISVIVVDDGPIGGGETARTTAHLSSAIDDRIYRIADWHGDEHARLAVQAHADAVDEIERIAAEEGIDCDFSRLDGYLVEAEKSEDDMDAEMDAVRKLGLSGIEWTTDAPGEGFQGRAIRFENQGQFHILKYLNGLIKAIEANGGRLFSDTAATDWSRGDDGMLVETAAGFIRCTKGIVLATNYPLKSKMFAQLPSYRTYAIGARVAKGAFPKALIWDTGNPYHYVRMQEQTDHDLLIVGGEDHRTGQADDGDARFENLWSWTKTHFPVAEEVLHRWSGQCFETHDGLAFIGRYSSSEPGVYLITGDSGMGMTHGTIGGRLVSDLILGRLNPFEKVFDPSRLASQSIKEALPEIASSTAPYVDWLTGGDIDSTDELKNGEGAIVRQGLSKIAAFRDETGKLHERSAVCTHLGCIVRFNSTEKTWDCPCHGSRFGCEDGHVINAPALTPLAKA